MRMKRKLKKILPERILSLYRRFRTGYRVIIRRLSDRKARKHYSKLIIERYPEISKWKDKGYVLDLGANLGHFSAAALSLGFRVISVEPHPTAFRYLENRFAKDPNVTLVNKAVSNNNSKTKLQLHPDHIRDPLVTSLSATIIAEKFEEPHDVVEVEAITFSELISMSDKFSIVKIDIEGAETYLFDEIITEYAKIQNLLLETHERFMLADSTLYDYTKGLRALEDCIVSNNLQEKWHTDWV